MRPSSELCKNGGAICRIRLALDEAANAKPKGLKKDINMIGKLFTRDSALCIATAAWMLAYQFDGTSVGLRAIAPAEARRCAEEMSGGKVLGKAASLLLSTAVLQSVP